MAGTINLRPGAMPIAYKLFVAQVVAHVLVANASAGAATTVTCLAAPSRCLEEGLPTTDYGWLAEAPSAEGAGLSLREFAAVVGGGLATVDTGAGLDRGATSTKTTTALTAASAWNSEIDDDEDDDLLDLRGIVVVDVPRPVLFRSLVQDEIEDLPRLDLLASAGLGWFGPDPDDE